MQVFVERKKSATKQESLTKNNHAPIKLGYKKNHEKFVVIKM